MNPKIRALLTDISHDYHLLDESCEKCRDPLIDNTSPSETCNCYSCRAKEILCEDRELQEVSLGDPHSPVDAPPLPEGKLTVGHSGVDRASGGDKAVTWINGHPRNTEYTQSPEGPLVFGAPPDTKDCFLVKKSLDARGVQSTDPVGKASLPVASGAPFEHIEVELRVDSPVMREARTKKPCPACLGLRWVNGNDPYGHARACHVCNNPKIEAGCPACSTEAGGSDVFLDQDGTCPKCGFKEEGSNGNA